MKKNCRTGRTGRAGNKSSYIDTGRNDDRRTDRRLIFSIVLVVLVLTVVFTGITANALVSMCRQNMTLRSENCANQLDSWTDGVIGELEIYKKTIEDNYSDPDKLREYLHSTYGANSAYPMGIYVGDDSGMYADASDWVPGPDWVLEERPWYIAGKDSTDFVFGQPYCDSMTNKMCISASARLKCEGVTRVMSIDVYLDYAKGLVLDIAKNSNIDGAMFVTDTDRMVIADSQQYSAGKILGEGNSFWKQLDSLIEGEKLSINEIKYDHVTYYVNLTRMESTGWYLVTYVKKSTVLHDLYIVVSVMMLVALAAFVVIVLISKRFSVRMQSVRKKTKTDVLTGIPNRDGFEELIDSIFAENDSKGVMMIFDMDNFKTINDTFGHPEGDKVLIMFGELLERFFNRRNNAVARIGGDEFAAFIGRGISYDALFTMLERFFDQVRDTFDGEYKDYHVTVSIGAAFAGNNASSYKELYKKADEALYEAKRAGKNRFKIKT